MKRLHIRVLTENHIPLSPSGPAIAREAAPIREKKKAMISVFAFMDSRGAKTTATFMA